MMKGGAGRDDEGDVPVKELLVCDSGDEKEGEWVEIAIGGRRFEVILCDDHQVPLVEAAQWGRPLRGAGRGAAVRRRPRDTSESRILSLRDNARDGEA